MIHEMELVFPLADVLSSLWYADGSGAMCSVPISDTPDGYHIKDMRVDYEAQTVKITVRDGEHPGVNEHGHYNHG